jgi:transcription elongation factor Elf1
MEENNQMNIPPMPPPDEPKIVQTDAEAKDGQNKCPKCGATDISLNVNTGLLRCNFCRHEFEPEKVAGLETDLSKLKGTVIGSGAKDIIADTNEVMTFKCSSCAAEVVIDTAEATQARCHWCRNMLSINQQIPNGAVPDVVLPFGIKKDVAKAEIEKFVGKRKFFAHPTFKKEFSADNVMGVYLPYMVVDINAHANLTGQGEHEVRRYTRGTGKDEKTLYDADLYNVEREFDIIVEGLTVESSADKLNNKASNKTNNIINSIMPFDTENSVKWDANYLKGYTSEKRDTNIEQLKGKVNTQAKDIARHKVNDTLKQYDRGVAWSKEELSVKGEQWKAAYLPVWLYSYHQKAKNLLHYVAVNARTKETMGSIPIHIPKLLIVSALVEIIGIILMVITWPLLLTEDGYSYSLIFLTLGFIYYAWIYARYRNKGARHYHEKETKSTMSNLRKVDNFVTERTGLKNKKIAGANNTSVRGSTF